jgi:acyl dehydratase
VAINREFVGREYPASATYEVGREHIRSFAQAIGDPNPAYVDPEAARALGHPDVVAPPTFLTVLMNRFGLEGPMVDPALGLDYAMVVHGEQSFELVRPVHAGDVLSCVQRVEAIRDAGRNELLEMVIDVTDAQGEKVAVVRSTIVSRGSAAPKTAEPLKTAETGA